MESLVVIFIMWWIFSSISKASKAQKAKQAARRDGFESARQAAAAQQQTPPAPVRPIHPQPAERPAAAAPVREAAAEAPRAEMAPRVQTTVSVTPHDHTGMFDGSMDTHTGEGEDPHDHGQRPAQAMPSQYSDRIINRLSAEENVPEAAQPGLDLGWNDKDSLIRAFVMQEVLTRPCDRKR